MELKIDKKSGRRIFIAMICIFFAYVYLHETARVKSVFGFVIGLFSPFLVGAALAFVLNVPMRFIERKLSFIKNEKTLRVTSILMTLLSVVLLITAVMLLLVPQVKEAMRVFSFQLPGFFDKVNKKLLEWIEKNPQIKDILPIVGEDGTIDWMSLVDTVMNAFETSISGILSNAIGLISDLISFIYNGVFSVIFAFYCLARKETLARQGRKLLYSIVAEKKADETVRVLRMSNSVFSNFITGQCLDAVILGIMCAIVMAILRMPYIPLICVIIVVTALVPVLGALIGCAIGAFLIFVSSPMQALIFIVMFIVVQQIDNNIVYPRVVGTSIGLPGMWVLLAVLVGEGLMGVAGMLTMVPFASVLYALLREFAQKRVEKRGIAPEKLQCQPPELQPHFMFRRKKKAQPEQAEQKDE